MSTFAEIKETITQSIPEVKVHILDPMNDGVHIEALVISAEFNGKSLVQQHQMVMLPLSKQFSSNLHALGLKTFTPESWEKQKHNYQVGSAMDKVKEISDLISGDIKANKVVLFMKGSKTMPQCGFSARVVQILSSLDIDFVDRNVLDSDELRQGIKEFSNWPTIPQLYVDGNFIGGCDIITQMHENGELKELFA